MKDENQNRQYMVHYEPQFSGDASLVGKSMSPGPAWLFILSFFNLGGLHLGSRKNGNRRLVVFSLGVFRIALVLFNHSPQEAQRGLQRKTIAKSANSLENAPF